MNKPDLVNKPDHYRSHPSGIECIDLTENYGFNLGNAFKYLFRCGRKGRAEEDLRKAYWYLNREWVRRRSIVWRVFTGESTWQPLIDASHAEVQVLRAEHRYGGHMTWAMAMIMQASYCPRGRAGLDEAMERVQNMIRIEQGLVIEECGGRVKPFKCCEKQS